MGKKILYVTNYYLDDVVKQRHSEPYISQAGQNKGRYIMDMLKTGLVKCMDKQPQPEILPRISVRGGSQPVLFGYCGNPGIECLCLPCKQ